MIIEKRPLKLISDIKRQNSLRLTLKTNIATIFVTAQIFLVEIFGST